MAKRKTKPDTGMTPEQIDELIQIWRRLAVYHQGEERDRLLRLANQLEAIGYSATTKEEVVLLNRPI